MLGGLNETLDYDCSFKPNPLLYVPHLRTLLVARARTRTHQLVRGTTRVVRV
jgi:hypothetical protein